MRTLAVLFKRELGAYFVSLVGYLVMVFFLMVICASMASTVHQVNGREVEISLIQILISYSIWFWIIMLIVPPILTMRLFAEERSVGTLETLLTAPVTEWQVVLAKFFGALAFFVILWLPTLGFFALVRHFTSPGSAPLDWGQIAAGYLGVFLVGSLYLAIGCLASALTKNQIIAALLAFAVILLLFLAGVEAFQAERGGWAIQKFLKYISSLEHLVDFGKGRVDVRPVIYYISMTAIFLQATKTVLEARKWR